MFATNPPCRAAGLFHFRERICMTSPPTSPLQGEGGLIITIKHQKSLIAPPSLLGKQGCFILETDSCVTSPPTPLLQGEGRKIPNMKSLRDFKILIAPPSLAGKGAGGLGHRGL